MKSLKLKENHIIRPPRADAILEVIHTDLICPIKDSHSGNKYILNVIDEYLRKLWIFPLKNKSDVPKNIINFFKLIKSHFIIKILNILKLIRERNITTTKFINIVKRIV